MAETASAPATADGNLHKAKPEKPDEEKFKAELAAAEKDHAASQTKFNAIKAKVDSAFHGSRESPSNDRRQALVAERKEIQQKQGSHKSTRAAEQDKLNALDNQLKSKINEHKNAKSRVSYKNIGEVDAAIKRLQDKVESGDMKVVDEKKALAEVSNLNKLRKNFAGFDELQQSIDKLKAEVSEQKKKMDNPEQKALSDRFTTINKELDQIKAEQDDVYKNLGALKTERDQLHAEQQEKYQKVREVKNAFYNNKRAYRDYEQQAFQARKERQKAERDAFEREKRKRIAEEKLEEASLPAFGNQIRVAKGLIHYFDPSTAPAPVDSGPGKLAAQAQRTVDDSGIKGMKVIKKDDQEDYFAGTGGKKGKKGRKGVANGAPATPPSTAGKFNLPPSVLSQLSEVNIDPPMSSADVPSVTDKLKAKLETWEKDQDKQTKLNIESAIKEIERLEKEAIEASPGSAAPPSKTNPDPKRTRDSSKKIAQDHQGVEGGISADAELAQEKDAVADVAEELKEAKIEDASTS